MTVHYLLHEKKLPETGTYFDLVENQHVPLEEAIQKAFGVTPAQFDQAVKDYFHSLKPLFLALDASKQSTTPANLPQVYEFPELVSASDSAITAKPVPEADARAVIASVRIRIPDRREAGLKELQALATAPDPNAAKATKVRNEKADADAPLVAVAGNEIRSSSFGLGPTCSAASSTAQPKN